jgi:probable F420-dependent oxidoreductase
MAQALKIGVELPIAEDKGRVGVPRWSDVSAMARRAEDAGFDSVWVEDHLLFRAADRAPQGVWDGWSMLAAIAAVTQRVEIGPLVACTSFRNPALLAKMADTVDEISAGRLILGLGAGWNEAEYRAFGYPFDHRVSRFEEALQIIHGLLHDGQIDFEGTYYSARECELRPRGPRPQGPPILLGTVGERMLKLTAQYADLWNAYFSHIKNDPSGVPALRERVDAACRSVGRDPATLGRTAALLVNMAPGASGAPAPNWDVPPLQGEPEQLAQTLRDFAAQGIAHIILWLEPNTIESIEAFAPTLELLRG